MELFDILLPALTLLLLVIYVHFKYKDFPPGPYGLPLLGYRPFLGKNPIFTFKKLSEKYGSIVSVNLGSKSVVFLNDWETVKEGFIKQGAATSGRPHLFMQEKIFTKKDIIFSHGLIWKEQRHFTLHILRDFGFGRSSLESVVMYEVEKLTDYLNEHAGQPIAITEIFLLPVLNIIWNISAGKRFEDIDEFLINFREFCHVTIPPGSYNILNQIPFLRYLLPKWSNSFQKVMSRLKNINDHIENEIVKHESQFQKNNLRDFIDVYLAEIYKRREKDSNGNEIPPYNKEHLAQTIFDLFLAGEETTDTTMCWALLHMANNPNIQQKVQKELDTVVAKDSYLSMSSKALAPYTEATLLEIQRHPSLAPLSVPHMATKDLTILGYKIPKGTTLYPNIYAVHHDEKYWGDPHNFRPERFLDEDGTKVLRHECFIPFSVGPRACLGESLAKLELHLLFTSLLRRFTFETIPGEPKPSMEFLPGAMFRMHPFSLIVKPR